MKYCKTCRWADGNQQQPGTAICRVAAPVPGMMSDGKGHMATLGMFPPVRLDFDWCGQHDDREPPRLIHLAQPGDLAGEN